jgi:hypothetical protein
VALQENRSLPVAPVGGTPGPPNAATSDPREDSFWTTPGARKTLQFKNELLVDEDIDLEDVTSSFVTPIVPFKPLTTHSVPTDSPSQEEGMTNDMIPEDPSTLEDTSDRITGARDSMIEVAE